jgi:mannose-6-phosphate isomerase-like protein (cupin superfamily)
MKPHLTVQEALKGLSEASEERYAVVFRHGTLEVGLYAPRGVDPQTPHSRDEVYIVVQGEGTFVNGSERAAFGPGDFLFVPAGRGHRFEDFSDDLTVWVLFYGPDGGERNLERE